MKTQKQNSFDLRPIGVIRSEIKQRSKAPKQGSEGAPDAWLELHSFATPALDGVAVGDELILLTWLHRAHRDTLKVHPRSDPKRRLTGVFATRSPDRPNPIGLHQVTVHKISKNRLRVGPIEAIDGTPVIDIKPVLCEIQKINWKRRLSAFRGYEVLLSALAGAVFRSAEEWSNR